MFPFITRQLLDMVFTVQLPWTNPEIGRVNLEQGGRNLVQGFQNAFDDWQRSALGKPPVGTEQYQAGKTLRQLQGR